MDSIAGIHHVFPAIRESRLGETIYRPGGSRYRARQGAARRLAATIPAASLGGPGAHAVALRRAAPALARRDDRLRARAAPRHPAWATAPGARMTVEPAPSALPGVRYGALPRFVDDRGTFTELWRASGLALDATDHSCRRTSPPRHRACSGSTRPPSPARLLGRRVRPRVRRARRYEAAGGRFAGDRPPSRAASCGRAAGSSSRPAWPMGSWRSRRSSSSTW